VSYTVLENSDYPGNDIRQEKGKSVEELKGICNQEDT
jgi:hypothetical protein